MTTESSCDYFECSNPEFGQRSGGHQIRDPN